MAYRQPGAAATAVAAPATVSIPLSAVTAALEAVISNDVGQRGIGAITLPHQLLPAAAAFLAANAVLVLTGFPCRLNDSPPTETDGPPGAVALARAALALGKPAALVTDDCNVAVLRACAASVGLVEGVTPRFEVHAFPPREGWGLRHAQSLASLIARFDHTVAIERAAVGQDGRPRTMRGLDISHLVAPLDSLVVEGCAAGEGEGDALHADYGGDCYCEDEGGRATFPPSPPQPASSGGRAQPRPLLHRRSSTGIGDGGNELGMGKVLAAVRAHIVNGPLIAAVTPADHLITAGVSNWGGWALVAAVEALVRCRGGEHIGGDREDKATEGIDASVDRAMHSELAYLPSLPAGAKAWFAVATAAVQPTLFGGAVADEALAGCSGTSPADASTAPSAGPPSPPAAPSSKLPIFCLLPTAEEEAALCVAMAAAGARDGITGAIFPAGSVDGQPLAVHLAVLADMRGALAALRR